MALRESLVKVHTYLASRFNIRGIMATSMNVWLVCAFHS